MIQTKVITIGDELLIGQVVDTNSAWIGQHLNEIGVKIDKIVSIRDTESAILNELDDPSMDIILVTGGLGPTNDDITKETVAKFFGTELYLDQTYYEQLEAFLASYNLAMNDLNRDQALVPKGCRIIDNKKGTAPGMHFHKEGQHFFFMPGVPMEMKLMMENDVIPFIQTHYSLQSVHHHTVLTTGIPESELAIKLEEWENALDNGISLAYLPNYDGVRLRLSCYSGDSSLITEIEKQVAYLKETYPSFVYGEGEETLGEVIATKLVQKEQFLATAESCTGGYIAHSFTKMAGASQYFKGSIVAYENEVKIEELNVAAEHLFQFGAVSKPVVTQMVRETLKKFQANYAIATSGIAGPTGGTEEKPVGTVWIAVGNGRRIVTKCFQFGNERERVIRKATMTAMNILRTEFLNN
ncbi:CinA family nicotinamide mononucleotide deamidase-related protein [Halosquirtibacter laminarini]|uniref:CinA family nicotinamide mononucleotide deamidase-related protein n=1 Tax=Halosquirtibacter laminarini TaxID=3374600 RepID=A0AC61NIS1_9BACT|nr:CinA family nicotinamide mononucleotide deamidase-related protein [Prolixibacteraceae bacterium]